ncbi:MAG: tetratricopeptide repeat protein [Planctomycetes bacterium]|nr:tetratricopeptide repeat protein [Planctomycetota bacterium]
MKSKLFLFAALTLVSASGCLSNPFGDRKADNDSAVFETRDSGKDDKDDSSDKKAQYTSEYYNELGLRACSRGEYGKAVVFFEKAIAISPTKSVYFNNLGRSYYWLGEYGKAIVKLKEAARLSPDDAKIWANLGDVYRQQGNYAYATEHYHSALELAGSSVELKARVNYELGNLYLKNKDYESAEFRLNKSIELDPQFNRAILARMIMYHLTQRDQYAWKDLKVLESRDFEVRPGLKKGIIEGVKKYESKDAFRPGM